MHAQNKRKLLLTVLAILLIARFIVVPVLDWQQEQLSEIETKNKQLAKAENVIARSPQITQAIAQLQQQTSQQQALYYSNTSLNALKLQLQQEIETLFLKNEVKVNNFTWVAEIESNITELRAKITFEGDTKNFAKLQLAIASAPKLMNLVQWSVFLKKMDQHSLGNATGSIVLTSYNVMPSKGLKNVKG